MTVFYEGNLPICHFYDYTKCLIFSVPRLQPAAPAAAELRGGLLHELRERGGDARRHPAPALRPRPRPRRAHGPLRSQGRGAQAREAGPQGNVQHRVLQQV